MKATILLVALTCFAGASVWAQQPAAKDAKKNCACCLKHDAADHKEAAKQDSGDCCSKDATAACCANKDGKSAVQDAKADCCKDGKADCCKDPKDCCGTKSAQMCQSKGGKGCCGEKEECAAKTAPAK